MLSINYSTDNISFVGKMNRDPHSLKSLITGSFNYCILKTIFNTNTHTSSGERRGYVFKILLIPHSHQQDMFN